jgi:hypothetical protein
MRAGKTVWIVKKEKKTLLAGLEVLTRRDDG